MPDAGGLAASFECGSSVAFEIKVEDSVVSDAAFVSNGCGYMIAAASVLAGWIKGRRLGELHGLNHEKLASQVEAALIRFPRGRRQCLAVVAEALHSTFANFREKRIAEYNGEAALICTCFGVAEETIEKCITANRAHTVDEVTNLTRAGGGCGACRMLIQEMLDTPDQNG